MSFTFMAWRRAPAGVASSFVRTNYFRNLSLLSLTRGRGLYVRNTSNLANPSGSVGPGTTRTGSRTFYAFALGSLFSGSLAYYLASGQSSGFVGKAVIPDTKSGLNESYGTPQDFQNAIAELRSTLGEETVSTDADVLEVHGFSENDYHPSKFANSSELFHHDEPCICGDGEVHPLQSSFSPILQMMWSRLSRLRINIGCLLFRTPVPRV